MRVSSAFAKVERVERLGPTTPPLPPKGGGGGGWGGAGDADRRREAADWIRQSLPICSAFAAATRAEFGDGVRMTFASEAGHSIGKPLDPPAFSVSGDDLVPTPIEKAKR